MTTPMDIDISLNTPDNTSVDMLTRLFQHMHLDSKFLDVFGFLYRYEPNVIINFKPINRVHYLQGQTKFNVKYEKAFIESVKKYNELSKTIILEYKKEMAQSHYYDCVYSIRMTAK